MNNFRKCYISTVVRVYLWSYGHRKDGFKILDSVEFLVCICDLMRNKCNVTFNLF